MINSMKRRQLLKGALGLSALSAVNFASTPTLVAQHIAGRSAKASQLKISLNAFSFNAPLTDGSMDVHDMLEYCSEVGFAAVDITAYYFKGYPNVPPDDYLFEIKRHAFRLGLDISGTGVRNDFTLADPEKRKEEIKLVKNWIEAAAKLGAPVIRIFAGAKVPDGFSWNNVAAWMVKDIQECIDHGKKFGVTVAIQNHNDFIKTAEHVTRIMDMIDSEWFGLILDTGSYRVGDPYEEIEKTIPYAVNWQIKELIFENGEEVETDLKRLVDIIKASSYKGYLPIETLGTGDPKQKVKALYDKLNKVLST
ncbi:Xylose isomerase [Imperialibacter sp. EC-SDR9]|nr:Xylose isomerase [Imperialibacter sp. 75]CAD5260044.1 Xylose isomerase [Imperialibacter sp. 89]VVT25828.1 Xylose isomerase [Imperialibacter sp. EC-SDR9]